MIYKLKMLKAVKMIRLKYLDRQVSFFYLLNESVAFNVLTCLQSLLSPSELDLYKVSMLEKDYIKWTFLVGGKDIRGLQDSQIRETDAPFELINTVTPEESIQILATAAQKSDHQKEEAAEQRVEESTRVETVEPLSALSKRIAEEISAD